MRLDHNNLAERLLRNGQTSGSVRAFAFFISPLLFGLFGIVFTYVITYLLALILMAFGVYHDVACFPTLYVLFAAGFAAAGIAVWGFYRKMQQIQRAMTSDDTSSLA